MPIFRVTTKVRKQTNGIMIEPGMSVQVVTNSFNNPVCTNGGWMWREWGKVTSIFGMKK